MSRTARLIGVSLLTLIVAPARAGEVRIRATTPAEAGDWSRRVDDWVAAGHLRRKQSREDGLLRDRRHERFVQQVNGIPVFGAEVTRQQGPRGTVSVFGVLQDAPAIDTLPAISDEAALTIVGGLAGVPIGPLRRPQLVVFPADDGKLVLSWRHSVMSPGGLFVYFIDAKTGGLVHRYNNLQTQEAPATALGTGVLGQQKKLSVSQRDGAYVASDELRPPAIRTYDLKGNLFRWLEYEGGFVTLGTSDFAQSATTTFDDAPSVDAHAYAGWVYDYYYKRHGRSGFDGADFPIVTIVNPVRRENIGRSPERLFINDVFLNAFWAEDHLVYGVGSPNVVAGQSWNQLAGSLDVVAHEMTHGVTQFSSGLIYRNESGALNESFSDIMGVSITFYYDPASNYEIGDDVITPGGIRSMRAPTRFGDPDHYSVRYVGTGDNGGIHINSGIPNHVFFLAVEGGTNRVSGQTVAGVGGPNREQIEKAFYRAFTSLLVPSSNFGDARRATIQSARDLYGVGSAPERAITEAWSAVGVN